MQENSFATLMSDESNNRRPLKSRATGWANSLAAFLTNSGVTPNSISIASVAFAAFAGICIFLTLPTGGITERLLWLIAAVNIQLRLLCNLMDGMVAVEGGKGGPCGEIFNDFPDRVADVLILASAGYATGLGFGVLVGWLCACGSVTTAYVRTLASSLTGKTDFQGIMAKPQRMAVMTGACVGQGLLGGSWMLWLGLVIVSIGILVTIGQRLVTLSENLKAVE